MTENSNSQKIYPNQKLRAAREHREWTQEELANRVGTTALNVGRWERGVTLPGPHFRQELCKVFVMTPQQLGLLAEEDEERTQPSQAQDEPVSTLWNLPYHRNLLFTGREDILSHIHIALTTHETPIAVTQTQAISGLGGVGKTQTAIEYAYRYREHYAVIVWARAESRDTLIADFLAIAGLLHLPQCNEQDHSIVVDAVKRWFDRHEHWLLILDNADHLHAIEEFIPSAGKGHVLLTTRSYATGTIAQRIELDKMSLEEGAWFLLRRSKRYKNASVPDDIPSSTQAQVRAIVELLDGLPLALDQAGAYIEETGCSFADYLLFYKRQQSRLLKKRGGDSGGHPEPVATTWTLSFTRVERANPAAAELLRLCAFLHPDTIPETMIMEGASELGPVLHPIAEDELDLNETIGDLLRYSLVRRNADEKILSMHRLVQSVLKDGMEQQELHLWAERTVHAVIAAFPDPLDVQYWPTCQSYLPHVQQCVELIEQWQMGSMAAYDLLYQGGAYLREHGQYEQAKPLLQKALTLGQSLHARDSVETAHLLNKLGEVLYEQMQLDEAEARLQEAQAIYQARLGRDHVRVAWVINNLGLLYHTQGRYELANTFYGDALGIRERVLPPGSVEIADSLNTWASLFYDLAQYTRAADFLERSLAIHERVYGPEHPDVGQELNNLAMVYIKQGKYAIAESFFWRTLAIWEKVFGPEYHHTGTVWSNMGQLYALQGKFDEAIELYQKGIAIRRKALGDDHYEVARSLTEMALAHHKRGGYAEAERISQEALGIFTQQLGEDHPYLARTLNNLALLYVDQGRYADADACFQRALTIREHALEPEHPDIATTLEGYATLLHKLKREDEAQALHVRASHIRQQTS